MAEHSIDVFVLSMGSPAWKGELTIGFIDGLSVGESFWMGAWSEPVLLEIAYAFEQATGESIAP